MQHARSATKVCVAGGGIAGLVAALRLSERGYAVTLFEATDQLGGDLSSTTSETGVYDVFPHMFSDSYVNFWDVFENDLCLSKDAYFASRDGLKILRAGTHAYESLSNASSPKLMLENLFSEVLPFYEMYLFGYGGLDLVTQRFSDELLGRYSVNGFLGSRPSATDATLELNDFYIMQVWSIHSDLTCAAAYRDFVRSKFMIMEERPSMWLMKRPSSETLINPLRDRLLELGCEIRERHKVTAVSINAHGQVSLTVQRGGKKFKPAIVPTDHLVLAIPPASLAQLVARATTEHDGTSLVEKVPALAEVSRLRAEAIPLLYLHFKIRVPNLPKENVGLAGSRAHLTFLDITQLRTNDPSTVRETVLAVAASDFDAFPLGQDWTTTAYQMIQGLHEFIPSFELGDHWGDPKSDVRWSHCYYRPNTNHPLFINQVGGWQWRPEVQYKEIPNVYFAGNFCKSADNMATVEGAVVSGVTAAHALWNAEPLGNAIEVLEPPVPTQQQLLALKLAGMPMALGAKWAAEFCAAVQKPAKATTPTYLAASMASTALAFSADWFDTCSALAQAYYGQHTNSRVGS